MPTDMQYDNRMMMRDQEEIARRKKAAMNPNGIPGAVAGGMVGGASGGVAANPQVAARPYAPPLTVQEITQKFMGGPASVPTGIPQQSAQNPAPQAAPAKPLGPTFNGQTEQQRAIDAMAARRARVSADATQNDYKRAYDSGAGAAELNRIGQNMDDYRRIDAGYQAQQSGAPGPAFTAERTEAGRKRLQEQAARIAAERNGQPLPSSTDTWSYEAGQKALPKELQGQTFTHPQDQANYRDFSRFVGGAPSIDPATGMMTSPADREYKSVQQMREEEIMARRKAAQPIDFAPFDPAEAQANQGAAVARYQETLRAADAARGRVDQREGDYRTTAEAPTTVGAQMTRAQIAEQERLRERAKADTSLIPGQTELANAENRSKATDANYRTANAGTMSLRDQAKANEERIRAETMAKANPRLTDAQVRGAEADAGLKEAQTGLQRKQLENYGKPGGTLDTQQRATDATNEASADKAMQSAAEAKYGSPQQFLKDAERVLPNLKTRFKSIDPFGMNQGQPGLNITGQSIAEDSNDLDILDRGVVQRLEGYAKMSPNEAALTANDILSRMPIPGKDGLYEVSGALAPQSWTRYVDKLNTIRRRLQTIASIRR